MNSENTITIRNSFSIENILSKPHKNPTTDNKCKSNCAIECIDTIRASNEVSPFAGNDIVLKKEPINGLINDDQLITHDDLNKIDRNHFTSPDSSGCEEENTDNLSDITTGETCKQLNCCVKFSRIFKQKRILSTPVNKSQSFSERFR